MPRSYFCRMHFRILLLAIVAGFTACHPATYRAYTADRIAVSGSMERDAEIDSLIAPYSSALALEMNRPIGTAENDMPIHRPSSVLGNWVADVVLQFGRDSLLKNEPVSVPVIAILNTGGIRASLSKGQLTVGDVYKVMPFDNQVVALKLPASRVEEIVAYIRQTTGEPVAGFRIVNGKVFFDGIPEGTEIAYFWVITSDFLANGGDKMMFLQQPQDKMMTSVFLRDLLLKEIETRKTVGTAPLEERITF
jgi:2',3'-cyclic-nucleotide 2'-phosphodiesterase (5'-nucleotidase family)